MLKKLEIKLRYLNISLGNKEHNKKVFLSHINEKNYWQIGLSKQSKKPTISNEIESNSSKNEQQNKKIKNQKISYVITNKIKYGRIIVN